MIGGKRAARSASRDRKGARVNRVRGKSFFIYEEVMTDVPADSGLS